MLSSMTNDSRLNRLNSILNDESSIDDIFTHLTIPQIQKLNKEYKQNVTNAKNDLHELVGNKYRDLIKIAEDISNMYMVTSEVDQKLSDLSYRQSRFVNFSTLNSFSRYNSSIRRQEASEARKNEKLTILKNIINNQLVSFEIRLLSSQQRPPLRNTSNYIYYAKCFYTLEVVFEDTLKADKHLTDKLASFKASFVSFLRAELSSYNVLESLSYSNDAGKYNSSQNLIWEDIFTATNSYLADDDFETFDEDEDEEDDLKIHDTDNNEDTNQDEKLHEIYNKNSLPIINYLIAYIILNHNNDELNTLNKVRDNFINLRYNFLDNLFSNIISTAKPENVSRVDFYKIFKYIENTCDYSSKYFHTERPTKNELLKNLKQATGSWKASHLIGFHNWIENEEVKFDQDLILRNIPKQSSDADAVDVNVHKFPKLLSKFCGDLIKLVSDNCDQGINNLRYVFVIFHNFIICLKKLEVSIVSNGSSSKLIDLLSNSAENNKSIAIGLLENVISKTKDVYTRHLEALCKESDGNEISDILSIIKQNLASNTFNVENKTFELFSSNLVEKIDDDLDKYIDLVAQISSLPSLSMANQDICHKINVWFDSYIEYNDMISLDKESGWNRLTSSNCLNHLSDVLSRDKINSSGKWGKFSKDLLLKEFETLTLDLENNLHEKINSLVEQIGASVNFCRKENDLEALYYLLRILITLSDRLVNFDKNNNQNKFLSKSISILHSLCGEIFGSIINIIPGLDNNDDSSFMDSFDEFIVNLFENLEGLSSELPNRPSLELSSLLFYLASKYTSPFTEDYSKDYEYGKLFLNHQVSKIFAALKKKWIVEDIIQKKIIERLTYFSKNNTSIESDNKEKTENNGSTLLQNLDGKEHPIICKEKLLVIFANMVYLLQFTNETPISEISNSLIEEHVKKLNDATQGKATVDELSMKLIVKNITEFYKSNKGIYLPLLIS